MINREDIKEKIGNEADQDPFLEKAVLIFLILLILAVIFIPSEWLMKWSMWWNNIK
jgi:hypothetical protein